MSADELRRRAEYLFGESRREPDPSLARRLARRALRLMVRAEAQAPRS